MLSCLRIFSTFFILNANCGRAVISPYVFACLLYICFQFQGKKRTSLCKTSRELSRERHYIRKKLSFCTKLRCAENTMGVWPSAVAVPGLALCSLSPDPKFRTRARHIAARDVGGPGHPCAQGSVLGTSPRTGTWPGARACGVRVASDARNSRLFGLRVCLSPEHSPVDAAPHARVIQTKSVPRGATGDRKGIHNVTCVGLTPGFLERSCLIDPAPNGLQRAG